MAAALVNWVTGQFDVLTGVQESFIEALGVGVFLVLGLVVLVGLWLLAGAHQVGVRALHRATGGLLLLIFGLGIAGSFQPSWEIAEVSLLEKTAGGSVGDALSSPVGALGMLALLLAGSVLIDPSRTLRALALAWRAGALSARKAADHAPEGGLKIPGRATEADPWAEELGWDAPPVQHAPELDEHHLVFEGGLLAGAPEVVAEAPVSRPQTPAAVSTAGAATGDGAGEDAAAEATEQEPPKRKRRTDDGWQLPALSILKADMKRSGKSDAKRQGEVIVETLSQFGVDARVAQIDEGPSVTQIGIEPGWEVKTKRIAVRDEGGKPIVDDRGLPVVREEELSRTRVRVNKITRLTNDLALALAAPSIRVLAPVPGKPVVGIEVPNKTRTVVSLRGVIDSREFRSAAAKGGLPIALGRNVGGKPVVADLTRMPHLLIAGATGAGKSVAINTIIASLLMHHSPEQVRFVMVDPKRVELTGYNDIPHQAFSHVVTDPDEVVGVLGVAVTEMERRYRRFEHVGARNIEAYNKDDRPEGKLPYWVVVLDELADLMMAAPVEVEQQLVRLAQLARATGIHLVIATQRPSVDVVTGLIKANFPTRIAFATSSQIDARVILDRAGAEKLLGRGDMLFMNQDSIQPQRVQGTFVSDEEIGKLIEFWTQDRFTEMPRPTMDHMLDEAKEAASQRAAEEAQAAREAERDSLYEDALALAQDHTRISTSLLQRRLRIGYPRAARLIDALEDAGVIGTAEDGQSRPVLKQTADLF